MPDRSLAPAALDRWELLDFTHGDGEIQGAERGAGDGWIPVPAPGDVYLALIEAGRLPHPFKGRHEPNAAWVEESTPRSASISSTSRRLNAKRY